MACPALRVRLVTGTTCAVLMYISALVIAGCSDVTRSPTEPRKSLSAHTLKHDDSCDPDLDEDCECDSESAVEGCGGDSGSDDGDYIDDADDDDDGSGCTVRNHFCTEQSLDSTQERLMDSAAVHITPSCSWVMSYINSLSTAGLQASGSFFGVATGGWGTYDKGDTHTYEPDYHPGYGPDYNARVHINPSQFSNIQDLTKTVIHEAAHGYWGAPDPPSGRGIPYNSPGYAEGFADACYKP